MPHLSVRPEMWIAFGFKGAVSMTKVVGAIAIVEG